jgi:hypothetical protein
MARDAVTNVRDPQEPRGMENGQHIASKQR